MSKWLEERCAELTGEAEALRQLGRNDEALPRFSEALDIATRLAEANPDDHRPVQQRASLLYSLGALHSGAGRDEAAVTALNECEQVYLELGNRGVLDPAPLIADVKARRGRAKMALGQGASAVLELDEAVSFYRALFTEDDSDQHALDLARVLTLNAEVLYVCGDPDVAVAAADHAIRLYLNRAGAANSAPRGPHMHSGYFSQAAMIASEIHAAYGRFELALAADNFVIYTARAAVGPGSSAASRQRLATALARKGLHLRAAGEPGYRREAVACLAESSALDAVPAREQALAWERVQAEGMQATLAESLQVADGELGGGSGADLASTLTAPAMKGTIISPSDRCSPELGAAFGEQLAEVGVKLLPRAPNEGLRIGVEAHCLFAVCSRLNPAYLRYRFEEFGVPWARLLLECCRSLADAADQDWALPLALDLVVWNMGVLNNLLPWVIMSAAQVPTSPAGGDRTNVAELARECLTLNAELHTRNGDDDTARQLLEMAASLGQER
jgi:tetratricopeptide (TPR) repeat protein